MAVIGSVSAITLGSGSDISGISTQLDNLDQSISILQTAVNGLGVDIGSVINTQGIHTDKLDALQADVTVIKTNTTP